MTMSTFDIRHKNFLGSPIKFEQTLSYGLCRNTRAHMRVTDTGVSKESFILPTKGAIFVPTSVVNKIGPLFHETIPLFDMFGEYYQIGGFLYEGNTFYEHIQMNIQMDVACQSLQERVRSFFTDGTWKNVPRDVNSQQ